MMATNSAADELPAARMVGMHVALIIRRLLLTLALVGWVVPLWLSCEFAFDWAEIQSRGAADQNSFPYLDASQTLFRISVGWLAVAAIVAAWHLTKSQRRQPKFKP